MKLVIFGAGELAQLSHFYFSTDSEHQVVAFTVDSSYLKDAEFCGLPVVPFEDVVRLYPPEDHVFFVAVGYTHSNAVRAAKYMEVKALGYKVVSFVSSKATVLNGFAIGDNCLVLEGCIVQPFVKIGNNVMLWSGCHIGHHTEIGDHCFIAPAAVAGGVKIGSCCFIGINATLRDHITIGERCVVGAGAVILSDAAPEGVYRANETRRAATISTALQKI